MQTASSSRQRGITLIELVTVLAIVAGSLHVGVGFLGGAIHDNRLSTAANDLLADLYLARSEALKRNRRVSLCKSADGVHCVASGGWEVGWLVFHDENVNGVLDDGEELIARHGPLAPNLRLTGNTPVERYISYTASAATRLTGGGFQAGTLTLCPFSLTATQARQVIVNAIGRPRVQKATVAACA